MTSYTKAGVCADLHEMDTSCIQRDPLDPDPSARYKMTVYRYNRGRDPQTGTPLATLRDTPYPTGLYTASSPDGIHWPMRETLVHTRADGFGDTYSWMVDTLRRGYRLYGKRLYRDSARDAWIRLRHTCWSKDFASWSPFVPILHVGPDDLPGDQVYMNTGFVYGDLYLGFVRMYHAGGDGSLDVDLAYSRDGEHWIRPPEARAAVPRGEGLAWDSGQVSVFPSPPIRLGDRLFMYYTASADYHSPAQPRVLPPATRRPPGLCLATLRVDGFAGLRSDSDGEARVITQPLYIGHPHLALNVDARRGACRVGLLDEGGFPIEGYTLDEMTPICEDSINRPLVWRDRRSVSELFGRWIALDIRLQRSELFAVHNLWNVDAS